MATGDHGCTILLRRYRNLPALPPLHARVFHCRMCSLGLFITDVFTRLTRNLRIYDPPSLMHAILTIKLSRTSSLFSFSFGSVGFDRAFILFFKRGTIVTLEQGQRRRRNLFTSICSRKYLSRRYEEIRVLMRKEHVLLGRDISGKFYRGIAMWAKRKTGYTQ